MEQATRRILPSEIDAVHALERPLRSFRDPNFMEHSSETFACMRCKARLPSVFFQCLSAKARGFILHPMCNGCRKIRQSAWKSCTWLKPSLWAFVGRQVAAMKASARSRGIAFLIERDDVLAQWERQEGRCALTGALMTHGRKRTGDPTQSSIDRIDSEGNYTAVNIHLVCARINLMKADMSVSEFGDWCKRVVLHALDQKPA